MEITEQIIQYFKNQGYEKISINLWHEVRLYVNIKGYVPFSYKLDADFKIVSPEMLDTKLFLDARKLTPFLKRNKAQVIKEMANGTYFTD